MLGYSCPFGPLGMSQRRLKTQESCLQAHTNDCGLMCEPMRMGLRARLYINH
jgi:hypothetical protein